MRTNRKWVPAGGHSPQQNERRLIGSNDLEHSMEERQMECPAALQPTSMQNCSNTALALSQSWQASVRSRCAGQLERGLPESCPKGKGLVRKGPVSMRIKVEGKGSGADLASSANQQAMSLSQVWLESARICFPLNALVMHFYFTSYLSPMIRWICLRQQRLMLPPAAASL